MNTGKLNSSLSIVLALSQGIYFFLSGLWPLIHIQSFMAITGPKENIWLVKTVGMLTLVIGAGLCSAGIVKQIPFTVILVATGSSLGFILIDVYYVAKGVILPIYLLDAAIELLLLVFWGTLLFKKIKKQNIHNT